MAAPFLRDACYFFLTNNPNTQLTSAITTLKASAHKKPSTLKWSLTHHAHSITIAALITRVNSPNVKMLTGSESSFTTGRINVLISPNTRATSAAAHQGSTVTPSSVQAVINTATAEIINLAIIIFNFQFLVFSSLRIPSLPSPLRV